MEFLVIASSDLTRVGTRLITVLNRICPATLAASEPPSSTDAASTPRGILHLGAVPPGLRADPTWSSQGAQFGVVEHRAWILGEAVGDPQAALQAIGWELAELTDQAEAALLGVDSADPTQLTGLHLAGLYLDPHLRVPAETIRGTVDFSPARMCWERQYTYGVARFLADGWDGLAASLR